MHAPSGAGLCVLYEPSAELHSTYMKRITSAPISQEHRVPCHSWVETLARKALSEGKTNRHDVCVQSQPCKQTARLLRF